MQHTAIHVMSRRDEWIIMWQNRTTLFCQQFLYPLLPFILLFSFTTLATSPYHMSLSYFFFYPTAFNRNLPYPTIRTPCIMLVRFLDIQYVDLIFVFILFRMYDKQMHFDLIAFFRNLLYLHCSTDLYIYVIRIP